MIYSIKIEQRALMYIKHVLGQRPYAEVAPILAALEGQQAAQDEANALPIEQLTQGQDNADLRNR